MTGITGVLLRYNGGHRYIGDPDGAEQYVRIDTDNEDLAVGLCEEYLELHEDDVDTVAIQGRVLDGDHVPNHGYALGDLVGGRMLRSFLVRRVLGGEQGEAGADVVMELGDRLEQRAADLERRIARASRGVAVSAATPQINEAPVAKGNDKSLPIYSLGQAIYPDRSPAWAVSQPCWVTFIEVTLETPGSTPSLIRLWKNDRMVGECWVGAGETRAVNKIAWQTNGLGFLAKDVMIVEVKVAGTDAKNLAVVIRGAITGD